MNRNELRSHLYLAVSLVTIPIDTQADTTERIGSLRFLLQIQHHALYPSLSYPLARPMMQFQYVPPAADEPIDTTELGLAHHLEHPMDTTMLDLLESKVSEEAQSGEFEGTKNQRKKSPK